MRLSHCAILNRQQYTLFANGFTMTDHSDNLSSDPFATFSVGDGVSNQCFNLDHGTFEPRFIMSGVYVALDYDQTPNANVEQQVRSLSPRSLYITARILCRDCGSQFTFSAEEQRHIYEELRFNPQYFPSRCFACRQLRTRTGHLRREYDTGILAALSSDRVEQKLSMIDTIDQLQVLQPKLPGKMLMRRQQLRSQAAKLDGCSAQK